MARFRHARASTLEDVRRVGARLGHGPERIGQVLCVEVLHSLDSHRAESLEDVRHVSARLDHGSERIGQNTTDPSGRSRRQGHSPFRLS